MSLKVPDGVLGAEYARNITGVSIYYLVRAEVEILYEYVYMVAHRAPNLPSGGA